MQDMPHRRNDTRAWVELPAEDNGDAIVAAMAEAGVEYMFFTSGSEIGFYQEAIAKAEALGRKAPKLITVTHEHASLNAALGYAAVQRQAERDRRARRLRHPALRRRHPHRVALRPAGPDHRRRCRRSPIRAACAARASRQAISGCSRRSIRTASCGST